MLCREGGRFCSHARRGLAGRPRGCAGQELTWPLVSVDLLGLLKWRSNTSLLQQNLRQLMKVDGGEVVKVPRVPGSGRGFGFAPVGGVAAASRAGTPFRLSSLHRACPWDWRAPPSGQHPSGGRSASCGGRWVPAPLPLGPHDGTHRGSVASFSLRFPAVKWVMSTLFTGWCGGSVR